MSMYALMESKDGPLSEADIEQHFDGNLCRCTGYRPILASFKGFADGHSAVRGKDGPSEGSIPCR